MTARRAPTGPRALSTCGRGRPRSMFPQRHADEGRHPRQANASALRPFGVSGLRRNDGTVGAHLPTASWPDLIRPPRQAAAVLGPRVKPADDGEVGAKLDCARSSPAGEDARGPMSAASCRRRSASTAGKRLGPWPIGDSGLRRNDGEAGAHLPTASWPDLIRPPRQAAAVLGPRVKPADDGEVGAKLDCARSPPAGEDARGPHFRSVMPTKVGIHGRQTLRPLAFRGFRPSPE
jgi:hypothetical protein